MQSKTIIVTGSNSGIGYQAALGLARAGHTVVMMCRNPQRGEAARQKLIMESGNGNIDLILVDMASQRSIRQAAAEFKSRYTKLDALINNAANFDITQKTPVLTEDGTEIIFATNHLGPFLLTHLLLDELQAARGRVVNVASKGLLTYPFLNIEFDNLKGEKKYSPVRAYYHSKLAQIMFTYDLGERLEGTGVTVNIIRVPAVKLDDGRYDHIPAALRAIYKFKMRFSLTTEEMAKAYIALATSPEFEGVTAGYFDENGKAVGSSKNAQNRATRQRLWDVSAQLTTLDAPIPA